MKKRLLLVTHGFPFGESERGFISTEFIELVKNFEVSVLACEISEEIKYPIDSSVEVKKFYYAKKNIWKIWKAIMQIFRKDVREDIKRARKSCGIKLFFSRMKWILSYSFRAEQIQKEMQKITEKQKTDIIYTYWGTEETVAAIRLKKKDEKLKVVSRFHRYELYSESNSLFWQPFHQMKADYCDSLFFVCNIGKEYFNSKWGNYEKSHVCYLGTPHMQQLLLQQTEKLVVVSCSNIIKLKRVDLIIEALAILPENISIIWHHLGDGKERENVQEKAEEVLSGKSNIDWKFWGYVPNTKIESIYQKIKPAFFITTSSSEGLPVSVQEAFAMGIPVIGTRVGGNSELITDQKTGFLLPSDPTPEEVAEKIAEFYHLSLEEKREMGKNAYELWNEKYNAEKNAEKFVKLIERA